MLCAPGRGRQPLPFFMEQLMEVLTLTEREQKVLRLRFGLDDGRPRTLEKEAVCRDKERIRQIEAKALHPSCAK